MSTGYMSHVTRTKAAGSHEDTLNGFYWDLTIDHWPQGVYHPNMDMFKIRLKSCNPPEPSGGINDVTLHGNKIIQPGDFDYSGDLSMEFQDFTDLSLSYFFNDWMIKIQDRETRLGLKKRDLYMDATLVQLSRGNTEADLQVLKKWIFKTGILSNFSAGEGFGEQNDIKGQLSASISFEWYDLQFPGWRG